MTDRRRRNLPPEAARAAQLAIRRVVEAMPDSPTLRASVAVAARELEPPPAWTDIAEALGYRDHTTVMRAVSQGRWSRREAERARAGFALLGLSR